MIRPPVYNDGIMHIFSVCEEPGDFPKQVLCDDGIEICYREISVFDRLRYSMEEQGKEVTMKVRIPQYKLIDSHKYAQIFGTMHRIFNVAHVTTTDGFPESELTLIVPENELEVLSNDQR